MTDWFAGFFQGNVVSDALAVIMFVWLLATLVAGIGAVLGQRIDRLTHGFYVVLNDSHIMSRTQIRSPFPRMLIYRLRSLYNEEHESTVRKAQELTEGLESQSFEIESVSEVLGSWVGREFRRAKRGEHRKWLVDTIVRVLEEAKKKRLDAEASSQISSSKK